MDDTQNSEDQEIDYDVSEENEEQDPEINLQELEELEDQERQAKLETIKNFDRYDLVSSLVSCFVFIIFMFAFTFRSVIVSGQSMEPTLHDKDRLLLTNYSEAFGAMPKQGDIVVISDVHVNGKNESIIKRVIATQGQTVKINYDEGLVYVNDELQNEPFIKERVKSGRRSVIAPNNKAVEVPKDHLFVMGDNRNNSTDSRDSQVGFVPHDKIVGRTFAIVFTWPLNFSHLRLFM